MTGSIYQRVGRRRFSVRYISGFLLITGLIHMCESVRQCTLGYKAQTLEYGDCIPRTVLTRYCRGSCESHSQSNGLIHGSISNDTNCVECEVTEIVVRRVSLLCPDQNGRKRFIPRIFDLGVPHQCRCSACSQNGRDVIDITPHL